MTTALEASRNRLDRALLYLVTPARPRMSPLDEFLAGVLDAGVDVVQLREKEMEAGALLKICEIVRRRTEDFDALFIVNDRVDVAIAAGADGVHLGQDDLPPDQARRQCGRGMLIGLSTHDDEQISDAVASEADYIGVGPVYETPTKPGRPATGESLLGFAAAQFDRPWFAIGGINERTLPEVLQAGAKRVTVLRALSEAPDPAAVARRIRRELELV